MNVLIYRETSINQYLMKSESLSDMGFDAFSLKDYFPEKTKKINGLSKFFYRKLPTCFFNFYRRKKTEKNGVAVVFSITNLDVIDNIRKRNPDKEVRLWLWDSLSVIPKNRRRSLFNYCFIYNIKIYTFDRIDSDKYDIGYINQFTEVDDSLRSSLREKDPYVFFCGQDKNRAEYLSHIAESFDKKKVNYFFLVISKKDYNQNGSKIKYQQEGISYKEYLSHAYQSSALLEINQENQNGLTVRSVESILLDKKLITNNVNIREYDFYNSQNIYILGKETRSLDEFMSEKISSYPAALKDRYTFRNFLSEISK